jgi:hypothetical protein
VLFRAPPLRAPARLRLEVPFFAVFRRDVAICAPFVRGDGVDALSLAPAIVCDRGIENRVGASPLASSVASRR